ncbi:phosphoribosylformylglycinamidine synthase [Patescibacteria group bacterium]|nr:phosphoribosylformylglycinamidine synthase [Patescibacteria group bacterium]
MVESIIMLSFMASRIEIYSRVADARAGNLRQKLEAVPAGAKITSLELADVYTIDKPLAADQQRKVADMLTNPVTQVAVFVNKRNGKKDFDWVIETGFLPGVTDNVATTAREGIEDLLKVTFNREEGVYTSQLIFIRGKLTDNEIRQLTEALINPVIQRARYKRAKQYQQDGGMGVELPKVRLSRKPRVDLVDIEVNDERLVEIGRLGIPNEDGTRRGPLALDLSYMKAIQAYFRQRKRQPTDVEIESIAQTWSEHCKHTIFADPIDDVSKGLYRTFIKEATNRIRRKKGKKDICVSVFTDNSGAIAFDDRYLVTHKVETHNSPSALDPFGGSITGIVGVNRDTIGFGQGAKPVMNVYGFCFADPNDDQPLYRAKNKQQKMLSPRRIMDGVVAGVNSGGNCSGIPTPQGFVYFDRRYKGKPLVFVGTVGLIPREINGRPADQKQAQPGDLIVMLGGRVGLDGIHGATFSSEAMDSGSPATAVQIGDPITQKKLSDALVKEARDLELYTSITDNGAGGLSCSVAEMAKESGGCRVNLDTVPVKYAGLEPWQIWISESQERMTVSVPPARWPKLRKLLERRGVEATVIGQFTDSGRCEVTYCDQTVMDIDMDFLHDGLPTRPLTTTYQPDQRPVPDLGAIDPTKALLALLARPSIASHSFISAQYDHEVQGGSVLKPLQGRGLVNADATVTRPLLTSPKGVALSQGLMPSYSELDSYAMAAGAIDMAIRGIVAVGADIDQIALLDNFCWCSSNDPQRLGQLKQAVQACYDCSLAYETPFISGKDSMFNDFKGFDAEGNPVKISIPPTLLISAIAVMESAAAAVSLDAKLPGDLLYLVGATGDELGGSELYRWLADEQGKEFGGPVPQIDAKQNRRLYADFYRAAREELPASAISIGPGGLAVALARTLIGGRLGARLQWKEGSTARLFSESGGRFLVTVAPDRQKRFETVMKGCPLTVLGTLSYDQQVTVTGDRGQRLIHSSVPELDRAYRATFNQY